MALISGILSAMIPTAHGRITNVTFLKDTYHIATAFFNILSMLPSGIVSPPDVSEKTFTSNKKICYNKECA